MVLDAHFSESEFLYWDDQTAKVLCEMQLRKKSVLVNFGKECFHWKISRELIKAKAV